MKLLVWSHKIKLGAATPFLEEIYADLLLLGLFYLVLEFAFGPFPLFT